MVDAAHTFPEVWRRYHEFLASHGLLDPEAKDTHVFVTCGDWDLKQMLPRQLTLYSPIQGTEQNGKVSPPFNRWINIKRPFVEVTNLQTRSIGMGGMLKRLHLELLGRHHSGIDDCKNILRIIEKLREEGWDPSTTVPSVSS